MEKALEILEGTLDALNNLLDHCEELQMNKESTLEEIEEVKEAIKELEDLKNKNCGNCKYFTECDDYFNYCDKESRLNGFVYSDFCCNKWEKK